MSPLTACQCGAGVGPRPDGTGEVDRCPSCGRPLALPAARTPCLPPSGPATTPRSLGSAATPSASGLAGAVVRSARRGGRFALGEAWATTVACWRQAARLARHARARWDRWYLARRDRQARRALGERLWALGAGDEELRAELDAAATGVGDAVAAGRSTAPHTRRQGELLLRLADDALANRVVPAGAEAEAAGSRRAADNLARQRSVTAEARAALPPAPGGDRRRVVAGFSAVGSACLLAAWLGFEGPSPTRTGTVTDAGVTSRPLPQTALTPEGAADKPPGSAGRPDPRVGAEPGAQPADVIDQIIAGQTVRPAPPGRSAGGAEFYDRYRDGAAGTSRPAGPIPWDAVARQVGPQAERGERGGHRYTLIGGRLLVLEGTDALTVLFPATPEGLVAGEGFVASGLFTPNERRSAAELLAGRRDAEATAGRFRLRLGSVPEASDRLPKYWLRLDVEPARPGGRPVAHAPFAPGIWGEELYAESRLREVNKRVRAMLEPQYSGEKVAITIRTLVNLADLAGMSAGQVREAIDRAVRAGGSGPGAVQAVTGSLAFAAALNSQALESWREGGPSADPKR